MHLPALGRTSTAPISRFDAEGGVGCERVCCSSMQRPLPPLPAPFTPIHTHLHLLTAVKAAGCDDINIVSEKLTHTRRTTRFEDTDHLPLGIAVNSASFSANLLAQVGGLAC